MTTINPALSRSVPPPPGRDLRAELCALGAHLDPVLGDEIARLLDVETAYAGAVDENRNLQRKLHGAELMAGERRAEVVRLRNKLEDHAPGEHTKARHEARMGGTSWLRVTSLGGMRFRIEHYPASWVVARDR